MTGGAGTLFCEPVIALEHSSLAGRIYCSGEGSRCYHLCVASDGTLHCSAMGERQVKRFDLCEPAMKVLVPIGKEPKVAPNG